MKKLLPLLITIACLSFITSCKKSDEKLIIGTWEAKTAITKSYLDGVYQDENTTTFTANELTVEFKKDNTYTTYEDGTVAESGTYSIAGDQLTIDGESATFSITKSNLDFTSVTEETISGHTVRYENQMKMEKK